MEYHEDEVLTAYVWAHCRHLMTQLERNLGEAIRADQSRPKSSSPRSGRASPSGGRPLDIPSVDPLLAKGTDAFLRYVRDRLLRECGERIFINRCPKCQRIAASPDALTCFWCGHDWHPRATA